MNHRSRTAPTTVALLLVLVLAPAAAAQGRAASDDVDAAAADARELVVLVHGMGRTPASMLLLEWALEREGYRVMNWGYSSTCCGVAELARRLRDDLSEETRGAPARVHFVGHSLGGIIVRALLAHAPPDDVGRVVMLAPPNGGSRAADRYAPLFGWLLRPLPELTTAAGSTARSLPLPDGVEVAVIAGEHDAKVSVAESHLPGERLHLTVPAAHTFLMNRRDVQRIVVEFLRTGRAPAAARPAAHAV